MAQDLVLGDAEKRLLAFGLALQEQDFGDAVDRGLIGCIVARRVEGGCQFRAVIWPGLPGWQREKFAEWAGSRFARFSAHGPAPDGWQKQSSGGAWLLWGRLTLG